MADKRTGFDQLPTNVMRNEQLLALVRQMQEQLPDSGQPEAPLYENAPTAVYRAVDRRRAQLERVRAEPQPMAAEQAQAPAAEPTPPERAAVALASEPSQAPRVPRVTGLPLRQPAALAPRRPSGRAAWALLLGLLAASGIGYAGWRVHARRSGEAATTQPGLVAPHAHAPSAR